MTKVGLLVEGKRGERRTTSPKSQPRPTGKPSDYRKEFFVWLGDARWLIHLLPLNVPFGACGAYSGWACRFTAVTNPAKSRLPQSLRSALRSGPRTQLRICFWRGVVPCQKCNLSPCAVRSLLPTTSSSGIGALNEAADLGITAGPSGSNQLRKTSAVAVISKARPWLTSEKRCFSFPFPAAIKALARPTSCPTRLLNPCSSGVSAGASAIIPLALSLEEA